MLWKSILWLLVDEVEIGDGGCDRLRLGAISFEVVGRRMI